MTNYQNEKIDIIGSGLVTVDIVQLCDSKWRPKPIKPFYTSGGTVCNILSYLANYGGNCSITGVVGQDKLASILKHDLKAFGVKTDGIISQSSVFTRRIAHLISEEGRNQGTHKFIMRCFNCKRFFPKVPIPDWTQVDNGIKERIGFNTLLIIDRANDFTLKLAREVSLEKGVVLFEPGHLPKDKALIHDLMMHVDILKYSQDLKQRENHFTQVMPKKCPRLRLIIETRGIRGVRIVLPRRNKETRLTTTYNVNVVDSAGAGDAFTAGFIKSLEFETLRHVDELDEARLESIIDYSQALGALACLFFGSKGLLYAKTQTQIEKAIQSLTQTRRLPEDFKESSFRINSKKVIKKHSSAVCRICRVPGSVL